MRRARRNSYSDHVSLDFHRQSIEAMCRVAREVRIFPLLDLDAHLSPYADLIHKELLEQGKAVPLERVAYEFQQGGHTMMKIVN
jgi:hypothetical protein